MLVSAGKALECRRATRLYGQHSIFGNKFDCFSLSIGRCCIEVLLPLGRRFGSYKFFSSILRCLLGLNLLCS